MMSQEEDSDQDTLYMELGTSQIAQGGESRQSDNNPPELENQRGQEDGTPSRTQDEYRQSDRTTSAGPPTINIGHMTLNLMNSPVNLGTSLGNMFSYILGMKLYAIKDGKKDEDETPRLQQRVMAIIKGQEPGLTTIADILKEWDARLVGIGEGCVELTLRVYSRKGLERLWNMFTSGELERRLQKVLPISRVGILESDYGKGCQFFEEEKRTKAKESNEQGDSGSSRNQEEMMLLEEDGKETEGSKQEYSTPYSRKRPVLMSLEEERLDSGDFFGQRLPPLYIYLKRVLDKYPEGGQILKELVQNADDAKARNVVFLYDKSEHPHQRLWSDALSDFQGPALYAYNDASFTKEDWESIQHPEQSGKRKDPTKVGRFGLGFISVFHLTDMPCILSGDQIGYLDPLEEHFNFDPHTNTRYVGQRGKSWKLSDSLLINFPDQFNPFLNDLFECNESTFRNGRFKGTVFRLPLRKRPSKISASVFTNEHRVHGLFESFQRDAELSLLFLKNVESIAMYERCQSHGDTRLIFKVQIRQEDRHQVRLNTAAFLSKIPDQQDFHTVSCLHIDIHLGGQAVRSTSKFITLNTLKHRNTSSELKALMDDEELKVLPWMGMSFRISSTAEQGNEEQNGRVFCFLPLPEGESTGLPVHVHGYFGLGDNRRSIKWPDQESQHDNKARWNQLLVTEVLPEVYAKLILAAIEKSQDKPDVSPTDVYKGWPHVNRVNRQWSDGVKTFLRLLQDKAILYADNGHWMKPTEVYINTTNIDLISKVLLQRSCPVAQLPNHVVESLQWADVRYQKVTPAIVRNCIRGDPLQFLSHDEKLELLEYVTSDCISDLGDLHLLPLQNGEFTRFDKTLQRVFIANRENPSALIPNGERRFAASDMPASLIDPAVELYTQLKILSIPDVVPLLLEMLPDTWSNSTTSGVVTWCPGVNQHPSVEWMTIIWEWLSKNYMQVPLSTLRNIPLIPMPQNCVARLKENGLIFRKHHTTTQLELSESICSFLESVGAVVVHHDLPSHITVHPHLTSFIKDPTVKGVMSVLEAISHSHSIQVIRDQMKSMPSDTKDELRGLFSQSQWETTLPQKPILRELPFFVASSGHYVSANSCVAAIPANYFGIPVHFLQDGSKYILQRDPTDNLALSLGVPSISADKLLTENILPSVTGRFYSSAVSLEIMTWVLERPQFDNLIKERKFIPVSPADEPLSSPRELFEPTSKLQVLFGGKNAFPTGEYAKGKLLNSLKRVGLKNQSDVTPVDVLDAAVEVSKTQASGQADVARGAVLLEHVNHHPHLLFEYATRNQMQRQLCNFLIDLEWVPCGASPPPGYPVAAGWFGNSTTLYSPTEVGLVESALLIGSVQPLVGLPDLSKELLRAFGWSKQLDPDNSGEVSLVVRHLKTVANTFQPSQGAYAVSHSVSLMYEFLNRASDTDVIENFATHMDGSQPWVWHGSGFTTPDKIALSIGTLGVSLVPYLHVVPSDMLKYSVFLAKMGVQPNFQQKELCTVLQRVQQNNQTEQVPSRDDYQADLNLVGNILRYIVNLNRFYTGKFALLVPCRTAKGQDSRINMVPASECLYVDEERLVEQLFGEESDEEFDKPVIHESISNDVAQRLGLLPLSHFLAPVDEVAYEIAGPHETTVNAIKRNLDMYKNDVDIFKELIQNADDAGATEVKFLLDWRRNEHTAHNLLSDGMKACHGPALWAYNDARFSKDDFKNICSIAAQSKKHQLDKVGRFGLGFTSVYHLTDVPSVVSGPYVLLCDPRTIHLGSRVNPGQPGIKLDLTNKHHQRTLKSYPNQFQPYNNIFGCNLQASSTGFNHTLFRLPLRTELEAASHQPNQLSDFICDSKDRIHPLVESLKKSSDTLLLFTQNVVHVCLQELLGNGDIENILSVSVTRVLQMPRSISLVPDEADFTTERNLLKATTACINDSCESVPETTMVVRVTQETRESDEHVETQQVKKDWHFITSSCMARGESLELARTSKGQKAGVLPCGGVAAQLSASEGGCLIPVQGCAFSYLPLNVVTGLPFHVNGSFLLQPNRRQLWGKSSSGTEEFESRWNTCFMQTVLCSALLNLLQDLQKLQEQNIVDARNFQSLWPKRSGCESDFFPLVDVYYNAIGKENHAPAVIFNDNRWVTVHECFFTDWTPTDPVSLRGSIKALLARHQDPKRWVELEPDVLSSISQAGANRCFDDNTFNVERFLRGVFFPALADCQHIETEHQTQIVLHVLDLRLGERKVTDYDAQLKTTNCIPSCPNGNRLVRPDQLVNPYCPLIGSLYSEEDGRFPHGSEYRKEARLLSLTQLGMASNDLSWEDICERAESILRGSQSIHRSATLLKLIDLKLIKLEHPTSEQKMRIQRADFLPVLKKPVKYPTKWCESGSKFMSAATLYDASHKDLLGSVQPLLNEEQLGSEAMSRQVKIFLGIQGKGIAVTDVLEQLTIAIDEASGVKQQTSTLLSNIYSFLQNAICDVHRRYLIGPHEVTVKKEHQAALNRLCTMRFVLCDGEFRECRQLAFHYNNLSGPYLFRVPQVLTQFRYLLKVCGVRDNFEVGDYLQTLQLLKDKYQEKPLGEPGLKTAKATISEIVFLSAVDHDGTQNSLQGSNIYVPDNCCILRTPPELTFNDIDWKVKTGSGVYTHPDLSYNDAKVFGIITQREKQLATCSSSSGFEMDFGQHEELTDRLSSILRSYPNVSDVFKELLQNADDAGATEIHFVYDPRSHQTRKIISDYWAPVQKLPSVCVFNNKIFTEADIKGIQKVGVGGKRDDIATTGKFGIGFNAVYHLTDCPSFLSNSNDLCVFDPLLKYVRGVEKTSPGKKFSTDIGGEFRESFPDMLTGYLEDIDEFCGKKGTMFRFPLRKESSVISDEVYDQSKMLSLLDDFKKVSQVALLFLNNIKTINISCIDEETNKLKNQYSISSKLPNEDQQSLVKLVQHLKLFKDTPCEKIAPMSCVYSLVTEDSTGTINSWLISRMLGFKDLAIDGQALLKAACLKKPLPRGGVAALIKDSRSEELCDQQYKAYCFLPLPIYTQLPVHVNGAFELDSARKNLQKGDAYARSGNSAEDGMIHSWNRLLIENVIAPAYAELIRYAGRKIMLETTETKQSHQDNLKLYDDLFPKDFEDVHGEWRLLAKATLQYIDKKNLPVLPVQVIPPCGTISWHHPNSETSLAFFDGLDLKDESSAMEKAAISNPSSRSSTLLRNLLLRVGFYLLASSPKLCQAFQACGVNANFVSPQAVVNHLKYESVILSGLPAPLEKTAFKDLKTFRAVFDYCLDGVTEPSQLSGLPIRLTNDDALGQFTTEDELYVTPHWSVLSCLREKFIHKDLVKSCTDWFKNNGISDEAYTSGVFKKFTIAELGKHLGKQLPKNWQGCDRHIDWDPKRDYHPPESWLRHLWKFICSETSEEESQVSLEAIKNWPVFPTTSGKLVLPSQSKTVLFLHALGGIGFGHEVANALRQLGLPEIAWKQMCNDTTEPPKDLKQVLDKYLALPTSHGDVTSVIQFMSETGDEMGSLTPVQCNTLLHYFQEGYELKSLTPQNIQTIKQLPIFKLVGDIKTTNIQHSQHYYTVEGYQVLMDEANIWMNHMNCVFLEPRPYLTLIYRELGISPITQADVYLQYILPSFHLLTQETRSKHIKNIRDKVLQWASKEEREAILQRLTLIPIIRDETNTLRRAGYFFDQANPVFKAMVDPGKLLPEPIKHLSLFLKDVGLHTEVTQEDFIGFSKQVEARANHCMDENQLEILCANSKLLKNELDCNDNLHDDDFLRRISEIKFIPAAPIRPELLEVYPSYCTSDLQNPSMVSFVAYRGSASFKYLELVWSVSNLLPDWALPVARNKEIRKHVLRVTVHDCLGVVTEEHEIMEKVLSHTKLVCERLKTKNVIHKADTLSEDARETVRGLMEKIFGFMKENLSKHRAQIKHHLQNVSICPVDNGRVFVKAAQLAFDLDEISEGSLRPYLYRAPRALGLFDEILGLLGTEHHCSFPQLVEVLHAMQVDCGDQCLLPNEQKTAKCAVNGMFKLLHDQREQCSVSFSELYLPSSMYILRKAANLYYTDPNETDHIHVVSTEAEFILPLKQCGLKYKNEKDLIRHLPEQLRPKYLWDELEEKPSEDCNDGQHCPYLAHIKQIVNSEEMTRVMLRLYQHQLEEKQPCDGDMESIEALQSFSNIFCKTELKIGLYDSQGQKIAKQLDPSKAVFDKGTNSIYLEHTWPLKRHMSLTFNKIGTCCNFILGGLLDSGHLSYLQSALDCQSATEMNEVLSSECGIPEYDEELRHIQEDEHRPGTSIPSDIWHLLDQDPYNVFRSEEIVGYERNLDDSAAFGTTEKKPSHMASMSEATEMIYARIVDQIDKDQESINLSKQYKIDIGQQKHITVSVTSLFKFLRPKEKQDKASPYGTLPANPQKDREQIERELREVFVLPEGEQKKVLHRLYRKWHPDKNPGQEERTNQAFKFLKQEINRHDSRHQYSRHYSYWESEVNRDREEAKWYQQKYNQRRKTDRGNRSSSNYVPPSFTRETPDPRNARFWFQKAKEHFSAAEQMSEQGSASNDWISFQVYLASEVALKAAQYSLTGQPDISSNDINALATTICQHRYVSSTELMEVAGDLDYHRKFNKPRYLQSSSHASETTYRGLETEDALKSCKVLLNLVQDIIGIKE